MRGVQSTAGNQLEPGDELLIEDRDLAVEHKNVGPELGDRGGQFSTSFDGLGDVATAMV
jgi:hypothetical protein